MHIQVQDYYMICRDICAIYVPRTGELRKHVHVAYEIACIIVYIIYYNGNYFRKEEAG